MFGFKNFVLQEMPITGFNLKGQWGPNAKRKYGYDNRDIGILENPKAVAKIYRSWSNSKQNFDLWFLRTSKAKNHIEIGEVDEDWLVNNLDEKEIKAKENTITIIFTNNKGAEKIPMTAWTIAHRIGHAIRRESSFENHIRKDLDRDFEDILKYVYGIEKKDRYFDRNFEKCRKSLFSSVGKMKSAREGKLRNSDEFVHELVAQYIITAKIEFNDLPDLLIIDKRKAWGRPNYSTRKVQDYIAYKEYNQIIRANASKYEYNLDTIFESLEDRIFVM